MPPLVNRSGTVQRRPSSLFLPGMQGLRGGKVQDLINITKRRLSDEGPLPRRTHQQQFARGRPHVLLERMAVAELDPHAGLRLAVGHRSGVVAGTVKGPQQRVIRRSDHTKKRLAGVALLQPTKALPIVAQAKNFADQFGQLPFLGKLEEDDCLFIEAVVKVAFVLPAAGAAASNGPADREEGYWHAAFDAEAVQFFFRATV